YKSGPCCCISLQHSLSNIAEVARKKNGHSSSAVGAEFLQVSRDLYMFIYIRTWFRGGSFPFSSFGGGSGRLEGEREQARNEKERKKTGKQGEKRKKKKKNGRREEKKKTAEERKKEEKERKKRELAAENGRATSEMGAR
ncbi:hypothetical protein CFOL_v3_09580, partial [Cephalotus follicularis]